LAGVVSLDGGVGWASSASDCPASSGWRCSFCNSGSSPTWCLSQELKKRRQAASAASVKEQDRNMRGQE